MVIKLKKNAIDILKVLQEKNEEYKVSELVAETGKDYIVIMSAINDLSEEGLAGFKEKYIDRISLNEEGLSYEKMGGSPERQLANFIYPFKIKEFKLDDLYKNSKMEEKSFYIGLANLKRNRWISTSKTAGETIVYWVADEVPKRTAYENFYENLLREEYFDLDKLSNDERTQYDILNKRKLIKRYKKTERILFLTDKGKKFKLSQAAELKQESKITSEMLNTGSWKDIELKPFDVTKPGPLLKAGKIHPVINLINEIREIFISMGFTEIRGPIVESAFFNFDALFQPQDHPAREMHDTFYLNNPKVAKLPEKDRVQAIKDTHENGGESGSQGWGYEWDEDIAKKTVLRTHTTASTIRRLAQYHRDNETPPIKVFSIDRVFRNEKVDKTHLAEFMQIEGIVIGDNVNLSNLIAILKEFYRKMGFEKIVTRPGFFPYTEPSMEIAVFYDKLGEWVEMGGSGIFRPEVTYPWGIKNPTRVLAWGMGLERLAMLKFGRKDIRDLYINPIKWLRQESY